MNTKFKPKRRHLAVNNVGGIYNATINTRQRTLYGNMYPLPERQMFSHSDRLAVVAYLRSAVRNDLRIAGLIFKIMIGIGTPRPRINYADEQTNSRLENYLCSKLNNILSGRSDMASDLSAFWSIACAEWLIGGDMFVVFCNNGKIQIIPTEFVGSPEDEIKYPNGNVERDGVIKDASGEIVAYRIGKRLETEISYADDVARIVPAQFVAQMGVPFRAEEYRVSTKFAPAIDTFQDIADVFQAKLGQFKLQSLIAYFITKNMPPELYHESLQNLKREVDGGEAEATAVDIYNELNYRSDFVEAKPNQFMYGEVGEDIKTLESKTNAADFEQTVYLYLDFVCAAFGITTEEAFVGYRKSNYSSARASKMSWKDAVDYHRTHWTKFYDKLQYWIFTRGRLQGELSDLPADFVFQRQIDWTYPRIKEIDQVKAAQGDKMEIDGGLTSLSEVCTRNGRYSDEVQRERVNDAVRLYRLASEEATKLGIDVQTMLSLIGGDVAKTQISTGNSDLQQRIEDLEMRLEEMTNR